MGVLCVKGIGSSWTIFYSIVRSPEPCGMFSSADLGCLGLCLDKWLTCMLVGGLLAALLSAAVWKMLLSRLF